MDQWIRRFRSATPASVDQPVVVPGDPEREIEKYRLENGIELLADVAEDLIALGNKFAVML